MAALLDSNEVIQLAFTRRVDVNKIKESDIEFAQERYLQPVLTKELYADVIINFATYGTEFQTRVKHLVAYWTKFHILPELYAQVGTAGIGTPQGQNRRDAGFEGLNLLMDETQTMANMYAGQLTDYLNTNATLYPLYARWRNPQNLVNQAGGIISKHFSSDDFYND